MGAAELIETVGRATSAAPLRRSASLEVHTRLSFVVACVALALLGLGLGIVGPRGAALSLLAAGAAAVAWYLLVAYGGSAVEAGRLPPWLGPWLSIAFVGSAATLLAARGRASTRQA
jgi:lipopolysaccharide export LptBFGC system permease protein LptF